MVKTYVYINTNNNNTNNSNNHMNNNKHNRDTAPQGRKKEWEPRDRRGERGIKETC